MKSFTNRKKPSDNQAQFEEKINILLGKLDQGIDDYEQGRVHTIDEAWEEIDAV